jgi:hypothetical protein
MKDFARPRGRLRSLPVAARTVYSVFLAFTLAGLALTGWLTRDMVGLDLEGLAPYYAGQPDPHALGSGSAQPVRHGPVLELPPEVEDEPLVEPMSLRKLLEVTHFHLFSMPIYLLVLSHLFMLSRWRAPTKGAWITIATASVAGHIAAPWLARAGAASAALAYGSSGALLALSFTVMSAVPLWEMWGPLEGPAEALD